MLYVGLDEAFVQNGSSERVVVLSMSDARRHNQNRNHLEGKPGRQKSTLETEVGFEGMTHAVYHFPNSFFQSHLSHYDEQVLAASIDYFRREETQEARFLMDGGKIADSVLQEIRKTGEHVWAQAKLDATNPLVWNADRIAYQLVRSGDVQGSCERAELPYQVISELPRSAKDLLIRSHSKKRKR